MSDSIHVLVVEAAGLPWALPMGSVEQTFAFGEHRVHAVAGSPAMRLGVSHTHAETAKIAVIETHGGTAGVVVDSVEEVLTVSSEQIERVGTADSDYVDGVTKLDGRLPILLNPDGLLSGLDLAA